MEELYCFEGLKKFLNVNGFSVKEPYMPVNPDDVEWYDGGNHLDFTKDGIFLIKRNGAKQKVFLYRKQFHNEKPTFHVFACQNVKKEYIGKIFLCGNTGAVPVIKDGKVNYSLADLPICGYCAEMAHLDKSYNSSSYIQLLRTGKSIRSVDTNENLSAYSDGWYLRKKRYLEQKRFTCERCGIKIRDQFEQDKYLVVYHRNHIYTDDSDNNLQCLCLDCLSKIDRKSVWINGANKINYYEFTKKYKLL